MAFYTALYRPPLPLRHLKFKTYLHTCPEAKGGKKERLTFRFDHDLLPKPRIEIERASTSMHRRSGLPGSGPGTQVQMAEASKKAWLDAWAGRGGAGESLRGSRPAAVRSAKGRRLGGGKRSLEPSEGHRHHEPCRPYSRLRARLISR